MEWVKRKIKRKADYVLPDIVGFASS